MRHGVGALLVVACAPRAKDLSPTQGSARGGETVCVEGRRLEASDRVWFGGVQAGRGKLDGEGRLCVTTPPGTAGRVDVKVVDDKERERVFEDAFEYLPLDLLFQQAAEHYLPQAELPLVAAVPWDDDGDGLDDLLLLDEAGTPLLWTNTGAGAFEVGEAMAVQGSVAGLAALVDVVHLCHSTAEGARYIGLGDDGWDEVVDAVPLESGPCLGAVAVDVDGDDWPEVVELRDAGLRIWRVNDGRLSRWPSGAPEDATDCGTLVSDGPEVSCTIEGGVAVVLSTGAGSINWTLALPALDREDDGFELDMSIEALALQVVDAAGETFATVPQEGRTLPVLAWTPSTEGAVPTWPLSQLTIVAPVGATPLELDRVVLHLADGGRALVADFETWPLDVETAGTPTAVAAIDADGDGVPELAVGTATGPLLFRQVAGTWARAPVGSLPEASCAVGALVVGQLDDRDGPDLFVACSGQDLLYSGDGLGQFFEDSAARLPVEAAWGSAAASADLDRDGFPDLVVGTWDAVDRLYRGGPDAFEDATTRLGLEPGDAVAVLPLDVDGDADLDLLVVQGSGEPSRLFVQVDAQ